MRFRNRFVDGGKNLVAFCLRFEYVLTVVCGMGEKRGFEGFGGEIAERVEYARDADYFNGGARLDALPHKRIVRLGGHRKKIIVFFLPVDEPHRELRDTRECGYALPVPRRGFERSRSREPPAAFAFYE